MDRSILIVEDSPDDEALIIRSFKKCNLLNPIDVVHDGVEALDYLFREGAYADRNGKMPAVVLLDLKLPKLPGLDVLKRLRADDRTKNLPVVILTSSNEQVDLLQGYDLGCNSYVRKPIAFKEFTEAVSMLGLHWALLNQTLPETV